VQVTIFGSVTFGRLQALFSTCVAQEATDGKSPAEISLMALLKKNLARLALSLLSMNKGGRSPSAHIGML
jgi:hypothetical protein